jgi:hypothetical protein
MAVDGSGMVLWEDANGSLQAAHHVDEQLGSPDTALPDSAAYHDLAMLPDGDAALLASQLELRSYHYDARSETWDAAPRSLPVSANVTIGTPRVGTTEDGLIAVWQESDPAGGQHSLRAARFDPVTGEWTTSSEFADVATVQAGGFTALSLDTSPPGHAVVVLELREWDVLQGSVYDVAAGRWMPEVLFEDSGTLVPYFASAGVDASGRAWAIWAVQPPLQDWQIRGRRFSDGWAATETIVAPFSVSGAAVTVSDAGQALLLWIQPGANAMELRAAVAAPDGTFEPGPGQLLASGFLAERGSLRVATGPNGHTVAAWLTIPQGLTAAVIDW